MIRALEFQSVADWFYMTVLATGWLFYNLYWNVVYYILQEWECEKKIWNCWQACKWYFPWPNLKLTGGALYMMEIFEFDFQPNFWDFGLENFFSRIVKIMNNFCLFDQPFRAAQKLFYFPNTCWKFLFPSATSTIWPWIFSARFVVAFSIPRFWWEKLV